MIIHTHKLPQSHEVNQEALCAIEGLEDSGYLEHDRARLGVVHPLGAVQRILQHVFKRCAKKTENTSHTTEQLIKLSSLT